MIISGDEKASNKIQRLFLIETQQRKVPWPNKGFLPKNKNDNNNTTTNTIF